MRDMDSTGMSGCSPVTVIASCFPIMVAMATSRPL
jgi:hypothetical protein